MGRQGCFLEPGDAVVRELVSDETVARLRRVAGDDFLAPADFPVELRRYPVGSSMGWHKDEALYEKPQLEVVLTLSNTSDSETSRRPRGDFLSVETRRRAADSVAAAAAARLALGDARGRDPALGRAGDVAAAESPWLPFGQPEAAVRGAADSAAAAAAA